MIWWLWAKILSVIFWFDYVFWKFFELFHISVYQVMLCVCKKSCSFVSFLWWEFCFFCHFSVESQLKFAEHTQKEMSCISKASRLQCNKMKTEISADAYSAFLQLPTNYRTIGHKANICINYASRWVCARSVKFLFLSHTHSLSFSLFHSFLHPHRPFEKCQNDLF